VSLKSLGKNREPLIGEMSRLSKVTKKGAAEAMIVLSPWLKSTKHLTQNLLLRWFPSL